MKKNMKTFLKGGLTKPSKLKYVRQWEFVDPFIKLINQISFIDIEVLMCFQLYNLEIFIPKVNSIKNKELRDLFEEFEGSIDCTMFKDFNKNWNRFLETRGSIYHCNYLDLLKTHKQYNKLAIKQEEDVSGKFVKLTDIPLAWYNNIPIIRHQQLVIELGVVSLVTDELLTFRKQIREIINSHPANQRSKMKVAPAEIKVFQSAHSRACQRCYVLELTMRRVCQDAKISIFRQEGAIRALKLHNLVTETLFNTPGGVFNQKAKDDLDFLIKTRNKITHCHFGSLTKMLEDKFTASYNSQVAFIQVQSNGSRVAKLVSEVITTGTHQESAQLSLLGTLIHCYGQQMMHDWRAYFDRTLGYTDGMH